jgi:hypothetical protein
MMFKVSMNLQDLKMVSEEEEGLPVPKMLGKIPPEWEQDWLKKKLRHEARQDIMDRFLEDNE